MPGGVRRAQTGHAVPAIVRHPASHLPLADAPKAYEMFQKKQDGAVKILLKP